MCGKLNKNTGLKLVLISAVLAFLSGCGGGDSGSVSDVIGGANHSGQSSVGSVIEVGDTASSSSSSSSVSTSSSSSSSSVIAGDGSNIPVAYAGENQQVTPGTTVLLDGSASVDFDGDSLSYQWTLIQQPDDSVAVLLFDTTAQPTFEADVAGVYRIALVVNDGSFDSDQATVEVAAAYEQLDITDIELSRRSGSCENYLGTYHSDVEDIQRSLGFQGALTLTSDGSVCTLDVNEIPNHDFNDASAQFATPVSEQVSSFTIAVAPEAAASVTALDIGVKNVVFLNGVTADLLAAACYGVGDEPLGEEKIGCGPDNIDNPWRYDPMSSLNTFGTDSHNAHPQPDGTYHYHGNPLALYDLNCEANASVSPVIGFAADGFPVFGPCIEDTGSVRKVTSSYVLKDNGGLRQDVSGYATPVAGTGSVASANYDGQFIGDYEYQAGVGDLDECNGMTVDGQYGYYITDSYPWIVGCFKGTVDDSFRPTGAALNNLMHSHDGEWHSH